MNTFEKLQNLLADQLGIDESEITPKSNLIELGVDSLGEVEIVMAVEEEFNVEIDDEEAGKAKTVADVLALIAGAGKGDA